MPTLNWIGKDAVIDHHLKVPFHLLRDVPELACGEPGSGNLIVEGDNLIALKALLPYYAGQVKCIYIDPPYNTGFEKWEYNDNVKSPVIQEWLRKTVGPEGETLDRHDRWLCMMYPRLRLLYDFLSEDGLLFYSIDDNELAGSRFLLDEIFGASSYLNTIHWKARGTGGQVKDGAIASQFQYVLIYAKNKAKGKLRKLSNPDEGAVKWRDFRKSGGQWQRRFRPGQYYPFYHDTATGELSLTPLEGMSVVEIYPKDARGEDGFWENGTETALTRFANKEFKVTKARNGDYKILQYTAAGDTMNVGNFIDIPSTRANLEVRALGIPFDTPKPVDLLDFILKIGSDLDSIVLDSYGGSGTTGHAVLNINKNEPGSRRKFILAQQPYETEQQEREGQNMTRTITAERTRRAALGHGDTFVGLGGGFRYCQLGDPLFTEDGKIRDTVTFTDLARHVFFTETGEPLPNDEVKRSPFLGAVRGVGVYLLFNGILGDKSANGGNVLTRKILAELPPFDGPKVIYCAGCLLGQERLQAERITVRQTPYEIKVS